MSKCTDNCVFCKIIKNKCPDTKIEYETDHVIVIKDIKPAAKHHFLAIPKRHIDNVNSLKVEDKPLINEMKCALECTITKHCGELCDTNYGFHSPPFTSINHLHMHAISPASEMSFLSRWIFKPINCWYCTPEYVSAQIKIDFNMG